MTGGTPILLLFQQRFGVFAGGVSLAAEHAGEFGDAVFFAEQLDFGNGTAIFDLLGDYIMRAGGRGHLGQVRDAQDLASRGNLVHFFADGVGGLAADVRVDFVEDEHGNFVLGGEDGFEGEHHARHFAGGCDGAQRFGGFAGVGGELEFDFVQAGWF